MFRTVKVGHLDVLTQQLSHNQEPVLQHQKNPDGHMTYKKVSCISVLFEDDSTEFGGVVLACALNGINAKMMQLNQLSYLNSNISGHE